MRNLLTCLFAIMISSPAVFAAVGEFSRVIPTDTNKDSTAATSRAATISRAAVRQQGAKDSGMVDKTVASRTATADAVRNTVSRVFTGAQSTNVERSGAGGQTRSAMTRSRGISSDTSSGLDAAVNTVGRNERVKNASINSNPTVRRAGLVLRPSTAEVGGRATIGDTGVQTGSNIDDEIRRVQSRSIFGKKDTVEVTAETIAAAQEKLEQTATLNKSCQDQYNECMDQFCAVVDANQKRCSCSANISKYVKTERAVKDANTELNEVAQRIRYVGLSADEIRAIMEETEAEEVLASTKDNSENRSLLEEIEDMIRDPATTTTSYVDSGSSGLDMELDFSSEDGDMFSLDFLGGDSSGSMANLRGAELYKAAKKRCNTVLKQCKEAGATSTQITGNYDLAIDKDCIAYEQGLTKMNETLVSNVRSANRMLQKARLAVLQNKNQYDVKGCIAALDTCMTDEMVCGENYFKCIDPTKKYIDENGQVVLGQDITNILESMSNYDNSSIKSEFLTQAYNSTECAPNNNNVNKDGKCVVKYLLSKIGTKGITEEGLCRPVLEKCQRYTYSDETYIPYNDVVVNYIQRAMTNIRAAQEKIIYEYASTCLKEIGDCYNQQVSQTNSWSANASVASVKSIMTGACRNVALTCAYAVFAEDANNCNTNTDCIENISKMFYQSLLCPANSTYQKTECTNNNNCANRHCLCDTGYTSSNGQCVSSQ